MAEHRLPLRAPGFSFTGSRAKPGKPPRPRLTRPLLALLLCVPAALLFAAGFVALRPHLAALSDPAAAAELGAADSVAPDSVAAPPAVPRADRPTGDVQTPPADTPPAHRPPARKPPAEKPPAAPPAQAPPPPPPPPAPAPPRDAPDTRDAPAAPSRIIPNMRPAPAPAPDDADGSPADVAPGSDDDTAILLGTATADPAADNGYVAPPADRAAACHSVGYDPKQRPHTWLYNSRAFCLVSSVCILPSTDAALAHLSFGADPARTTCSLDHADLRPVPGAADVPELDCAALQHDRVHCAHGRYRGVANKPFCPPVTTGLDDAANARWIPADRVAVIVPPFPWLHNIFHYSFVVGTVTHILSELQPLFAAWAARDGSPVTPPPRKVTVVFRALPPHEYGIWAGNLTRIALASLAHRVGLSDIRVEALREDWFGGGVATTGNDARPVCAHAAVMLGRRGKVSLWPFPNSTAVPTDGHAVSAQSLALRAAVYAAYDLTSPRLTLPDGSASVPGGFPARATLAPPPLVLGYARRQSHPDPPPGETLRDYWRRFSDGDEAWVHDMLEAEAARVGATTRELVASGKLSIRSQIEWFSDVGVVFGIHGANLVNAMFAPPLGALVEVFPGNLSVPCYHAGGNAGLMYASHEAALATREESHCGPEARCWTEKVQRRVKIGTRQHREAVRKLVRNALDHVVRMRTRFPDGVPVRLDRAEGRYVVDDDAA